MFVVLWEYEVKPGREPEFEKVYGTGGDWDSLCHSNPNHAGTHLFRGTARQRVYLTTDCWHSRKSYKEFLQARRNDYHTLDAAAEILISRERHSTSFDA